MYSLRSHTYTSTALSTKLVPEPHLRLGIDSLYFYKHELLTVPQRASLIDAREHLNKWYEVCLQLPASFVARASYMPVVYHGIILDASLAGWWL